MHGGHNLQRCEGNRIREVEEGSVGGHSRQLELFAGIRRDEDHGSELRGGWRVHRDPETHSTLGFQVLTTSPKNNPFAVRIITLRARANVFGDSLPLSGNVVKPPLRDQVN